MLVISMRSNLVSHTYTLGEAGEQGGQSQWVSRAVDERSELHSAAAPPGSADPSPGGTAGIQGRLDFRGSLSPGPTVWPGRVWSPSSVRGETWECS